MLDTETLDKRLREAVERFVLRLGELADEAARQHAAAATPRKTESGQPDTPPLAPVEADRQPDVPATAPVEQPHEDRISLPSGLTDTEEKLFIALQNKRSGLTTTQLAEHTGCTLVPVFEAINRLMEKRLIERVDRGLELSQYRLRL